LPAVIVHAGKNAAQAFITFFVATIRNPNTRVAYARAVGQFFRWCEHRKIPLEQIHPAHIGAYIEKHAGDAPTKKQHLAAIRMLFDELVRSRVIPFNPASSVRGPKHVVKRGKTPVLKADQARILLDSIDTSTLIGLRDRALLGLLCYTFARVSAAVGMRVEDYYENGRRSWIRLHEKGGKRHDVPAHHNAEAYIDAYREAGGVKDDKKAFLFRSFNRKGQLTDRGISRRDVLAMIKRRARAAGLPSSTCCHTFRATGITAYLENGGTIENAQAIAAHESPRTTKLYDRTSDEITLDEVERIAI
jgi:site-specific recombinase XerD